MCASTLLGSVFEVKHCECSPVAGAVALFSHCVRAQYHRMSCVCAQMRAVDLEHAFAKAQAQLVSLAEGGRLQSPMPTLMLPHTGTFAAAAAALCILDTWATPFFSSHQAPLTGIWLFLLLGCLHSAKERRFLGQWSRLDPSACDGDGQQPTDANEFCGDDAHCSNPSAVGR